MMQIRHVQCGHPLTPEEVEHDRRIRQSAEADAKSPIASADGRDLVEDVLTVRHIIHQLKAERLRQGLSLADVSKKTHINPAALSRLENLRNSNPTITTLGRYARALGQELQIELAPDLAANFDPTAFSPTPSTLASSRSARPVFGSEQ